MLIVDCTLVKWVQCWNRSLWQEIDKISPQHIAHVQPPAHLCIDIKLARLHLWHQHKAQLSLACAFKVRWCNEELPVYSRLLAVSISTATHIIHVYTTPRCSRTAVQCLRTSAIAPSASCNRFFSPNTSPEGACRALPPSLEALCSHCKSSYSLCMHEILQTSLHFGNTESCLWHDGCTQMFNITVTADALLLQEDFVISVRFISSV